MQNQCLEEKQMNLRLSDWIKTSPNPGAFTEDMLMLAYQRVIDKETSIEQRIDWNSLTPPCTAVNGHREECGRPAEWIGWLKDHQHCNPRKHGMCDECARKKGFCTKCDQSGITIEIERL